MWSSSRRRQPGWGYRCRYRIPGARDPAFRPASSRRHPAPPLTETTFDGPLGGPSYAYRGAVIDCLKGGHVCRLTMDGHPLTGMSFGVAGTITPLVDLWLEEGRLPDYMRTSPKAGR